jgi:peptidoglycan-associated lipoprotein
MNKTFIALISSVLLLTACESASTDGGSGTGGGASGRNGGSVVNTAPGTQGDLAVNIGDRVLFGYDSAVLTNESLAVLGAQATWLNEYPNVNIVVEGHCDERGTREYNIALGERRAASAKKALVSLGIAANRVSTISYGKERPAVLGSNNTAYSQNRRAVTVIAN